MYIRSLLLMALLASCGGGAGSKIVQEEVAPPNNSPVLTNIRDYSVLEGDTFSLSIVASDLDGDVLTYSLLGADAEQFSLSESNVLVFAVEPDFESPQDTNADNKYEVTVTVSDGRADDSVNMTVQVEDALEGRVVDGPITGAVLQLSGSSDATETGPDGFFSFGAADDALGERVTALGGVDSFTGVALPDLVLMSDVLASVEESTAVNAITTLLAMADDPDSRSAVLKKLGLDLSQRDVSVMDIWAEADTESGDARSRYAQHVNAQLSLFLLTGQSFAQTLTSRDPTIVVEELASQMVHVLTVSDSTGNLADSRVIALALSAVLETLGEDEGVSGDQLPKISASLADVMTVLGDLRLNPTSETTAAVSRVGQDSLQLLVKDLVANRIDIASFEQAASLKTLFSSIPRNPDDIDTDGDGLSDVLDADDDGDGTRDVEDAFPLDSAEAIDTDGDGVGDNEDSDDDGDGSADIDDIFPLNPDESLDTDGDGVGNNADLDDDSDGVPDVEDAFPLDSAEAIDTDDDGVGDNADFDDDGDGSLDLEDAFPLDPDESEDTDGDGIGNNTDPDDDNDGVLDVDDALPLDSTETVDTDSDGIGNNADPDDDGDGVDDVKDAFPLDSTETTDTDGDGIGNNADPDDDGDSVDDEDDIEPLNPSVTGFFVGGHLLIDAGIVLDSDTNDPGNDFVRNNTSQLYEPDPDTAQEIESPFMLHGYVNKPLFGPEGTSFELGDEDDFFTVNVLEGQRFTLLIDDYLQGDLDFYLWDDNLQIVASSESAGPTEILSAPADGTYYLNIYAWSGASTYSVETDFVSDQEVSSALRYGEAIVTLAEDKGTSKNSKTNLFGELEKRHKLVSLSGASRSTKLVKARQDSDLLTSKSTHPKFEFFSSRGLREKAVTQHLVKALLEDPSVERAQPNYIYFPTKITNDTLLSDMWNLSQISIPQAWEISSGDPAVVVAVIDTGVLSNHPDLSGRAVHGYDFISRSDNTDGDGIDTDPEDSMLDIDTCDGRPAFYHGSHVAGTIGATGDNAEGIVGASYSASLMHLRALDGSCGGTTYDIVQAIRYSLGAPNDSGTIPDKPADIINMSLGGGPFDEYFSAAVNDAFESGVIVIAASGNTGGRVEYPARYESVIGVGASGFEGAVTSYSNKGVDLGLVAPGGDNAGGILSLHKIDNEYTYTEGQGTSMASPHVAGVVALMKSIHPNLSPSRVRELIDFGLVTDDINDPGFDIDSGWGRVNAKKAVETALADANGSLRLPARIVLSARQLYFDSGDISTSVSASNPGDMSLSLNSVTASTLPWVSISRTNTDSAGSVIGTWLISVDRANLSAGFYRGSVTFSGVDEEGTEVSSSLVLSMKVADDGEGELGVIRVALFDANTGASVWNSSTGKSNGYSYRLGVPKQGEYRIVARTDIDNSGVKCGFGDYCGGGIEVLVEPTSGLDFRVLRQGDTAERAK